MHYASNKDLVDLARALIKAGANVDMQDANGDTALHTATKKQNIDMVTVLLGAGARVDIKNKKGMRSLFTAHYMGHYLGNEPLENLFSAYKEKLKPFGREERIIFHQAKAAVDVFEIFEELNLQSNSDEIDKTSIQS